MYKKARQNIRYLVVNPKLAKSTSTKRQLAFANSFYNFNTT
jgi:hypothetical protein